MSSQGAKLPFKIKGHVSRLYMLLIHLYMPLGHAATEFVHLSYITILRNKYIFINLFITFGTQSLPRTRPSWGYIISYKRDGDII